MNWGSDLELAADDWPLWGSWVSQLAAAQPLDARSVSTGPWGSPKRSEPTPGRRHICPSPDSFSCPEGEPIGSAEPEHPPRPSVTHVSMNWICNRRVLFTDYSKKCFWFQTLKLQSASTLNWLVVDKSLILNVRKTNNTFLIRIRWWEIIRKQLLIKIWWLFMRFYQNFMKKPSTSVLIYTAKSIFV